LKAEEGGSGSRAVVCLIDTEEKPEGSDKSEGSAEAAPSAPVAEAPKAAAAPAPTPAAEAGWRHMLQGHLQLQENFR
jgi:pyruvate/2-oxoglutarate dehydrogenase complex dihydrolipoamide acyltransferase (E2) component